MLSKNSLISRVKKVVTNAKKNNAIKPHTKAFEN